MKKEYISPKSRMYVFENFCDSFVIKSGDVFKEEEIAAKRRTVDFSEDDGDLWGVNGF